MTGKKCVSAQGEKSQKSRKLFSANHVYIYMTFWNLFQLSLLRLHSLAASRDMRISLTLISALTALAAVLCAGLLLFIAAGPGAASMDAELFWNEIIEHYAAAALVILIFWLLSLFQVKQTTTSEQMFLSVLPLTPLMHALFRLLQIVYGSLWVQAGVTMLCLFAAGHGSLAFTARVIWVSAGIYLTSAAGFMAAESFTLGSRRGGRAPSAAWVPSLIMVLLYVLLHVLLLALSPFLTGAAPLCIGTLFLCVIMAVLLTAAFRQLRLNKQRPFPAGAGRRNARIVRATSLFTGIPAPFLFARKNIHFFMRSRQAVRSLFSGILLLSLLFSFVLNNQSAADRTALSLFITSTLFVFLAYRGQSYLNRTNEPVSLVNTLPVSRAMLYFGMSVPVFINGLCISGVFAVMLLAAGSSLSSVLSFLVTSAIAGAAVTNAAAVCAVKAFPDRDKAAASFWISLGVVSLPMILLYPYWLIILLFWSVMHVCLPGRPSFFQKEELSA